MIEPGPGAYYIVIGEGIVALLQIIGQRHCHGQDDGQQYHDQQIFVHVLPP